MKLFSRIATEPNNFEEPDCEVIYILNDKGELEPMEDEEDERVETR